MSAACGCGCGCGWSESARLLRGGLTTLWRGAGCEGAQRASKRVVQLAGPRPRVNPKPRPHVLRWKCRCASPVPGPHRHSVGVEMPQVGVPSGKRGRRCGGQAGVKAGRALQAGPAGMEVRAGAAATGGDGPFAASHCLSPCDAEHDAGQLHPAALEAVGAGEGVHRARGVDRLARAATRVEGARAGGGGGAALVLACFARTAIRPPCNARVGQLTSQEPQPYVAML